MRQSLTIIFYILAVFLFFIGSIGAFEQGAGGDIFNTSKLSLIGTFWAIGLVLFLIGLAIAKFENIMRDSGAVLIFTGCCNLFLIIVYICVFLDPSFKSELPNLLKEVEVSSSQMLLLMLGNPIGIAATIAMFGFGIPMYLFSKKANN